MNGTQPTPNIALGELCSYQNGGTPSKKNPNYWGGEIPWITSSEIKGGSVLPARSSITKLGESKSAAKRVPQGTLLLVSRTGVGKIAVAPYSLAFSQDITAVFPNAATLYSGYLYRFLAYQSKYFERNSRGATIKGITRDVLNCLQIPLPLLAEQKRIAEILDRAEALRAKRRAALALLDELTQSIFLDMFGDPRERIALGGVELDAVVEEFRYGTSNKSGENGYPALRIPNIIRGSIDCTELKSVLVDDAEYSRLRLVDGDMLFVRTNGNPDYVGRCAVFERSAVGHSAYNPEEFIYASYLIRARLKASVLPVFIRELMLTSEGRKNTRAKSKTSAGQYNINTKGLGSLPIFVPSIEQQREFVDRVQAVNGMKTVHSASASELDQLFASLQHRAFRGEL